MYSVKNITEENSKTIAECNHRNAVVLLRENFKSNRVGVLSKSEYRFLMGEGLISRQLSGIRQGRVYVLTNRAVKELRELGMTVTTEAFAKCVSCGFEAHTREDLEQFLRWVQGKYRRRNICLKCFDGRRKYDK
jgi:hypothetical protein